MSSPARKPTILVADDIPLFRELLEVFLARAGQVVSASDGRTALALARKHRPAVVIADLEMPGLDGASLCRALRRDPELASTPFVMLVPGERAADRACAIRAGANDVLPKPIHRAELMQSVMRLMRSPTRGLPRVAVDAPILIRTRDDEASARIRNLSRGGLFVETRQPLDPQEELALSFRLPESEHRLAPTASVAWHEQDDHARLSGHGLRFLAVDAATLREIEAFVHERSPSVDAETERSAERPPGVRRPRRVAAQSR